MSYGEERDIEELIGRSSLGEGLSALQRDPEAELERLQKELEMLPDDFWE